MTVLILLFTNSYKKIERAVIGFVSVIGLSFIYELFLVHIDWGRQRVQQSCRRCPMVRCSSS